PLQSVVDGKRPWTEQPGGFRRAGADHLKLDASERERVERIHADRMFVEDLASNAGYGQRSGGDVCLHWRGELSDRDPVFVHAHTAPWRTGYPRRPRIRV